MAIHNEIRRLHEVAAIWRCDHHFIIGEPDAATRTAIERFANIAMPGKFFKSVDASRLTQSANIADPMEEVRDRMSDTGNVLCIYGVGSLLWAAGRQVGAYIEECMVSGDAPTIFFLGNRSEIEQLKEQYPVMAGKVPAENMVEIEPLTADEIMYGIQHIALVAHPVADFLHGVSNIRRLGKAWCVNALEKLPRHGNIGKALYSCSRGRIRLANYEVVVATPDGSNLVQPSNLVVNGHTAIVQSMPYGHRGLLLLETFHKLSGLMRFLQ